jgi:hypothetical protein
METTREEFSFGGRPFALTIEQHDQDLFSVILTELAPNVVVCYAADFLDEDEADIEFERVKDDIAAFV